MIASQRTARPVSEGSAAAEIKIVARQPHCVSRAEQYASRGGIDRHGEALNDRSRTFLMSPVLQGQRAGTDVDYPEPKDRLTARAHSGVRITGRRFGKLQQLGVIAIGSPAVAGGGVLRQVSLEQVPRPQAARRAASEREKIAPPHPITLPARSRRTAGWHGTSHAHSPSAKANATHFIRSPRRRERSAGSSPKRECAA